MSPLLRILTLTLACAATDPAFAAGQVRVGVGSSMLAGAGSIDLGCASLRVDGQLNGRWLGIDSVELGSTAALSPERLAFGGDWTSATTARIEGLVAWVDPCGHSPASMWGRNDFDMLEVRSDIGLERRFDAAGSQSVRQSLLLQGGAARLQLASTMAGQVAPFTLRPQASQQISRVEVRDLDSNAGQRIAPGSPADFDSLDAGNNRNWFLGSAVEVPVLGLAGLTMLSLILLSIAQDRLTQPFVSSSNRRS
jgi:hypothetical protein